MVHSDGVPRLELHHKLSPNIVSPMAIEAGRVAHCDPNNNNYNEKTNDCWIV